MFQAIVSDTHLYICKLFGGTVCKNGYFIDDFLHKNLKQREFSWFNFDKNGCKASMFGSIISDTHNYNCWEFGCTSYKNKYSRNFRTIFAKQ